MLAAADRLDPADQNLEARQIRETAASIRENRPTQPGRRRTLCVACADPLGLALGALLLAQG